MTTAAKTPKAPSAPDSQPEPAAPETESTLSEDVAVPTVSVEPVARITTKPERPTVEIDGVFYEMRLIGDYGIGAQQRLNRDGREFYELWTSEDELSDDQQKRLKFLLDRMFLGSEKIPALVDAPRKLLQAFNDGDRADVVLSFTLAPLRKAMQAAAQQQTQDQVEAQDGTSTSTS